MIVLFTGETTAPPPQVIEAGPSVITDTGSSHSQLYMVLGAVLGGLGLLLTLFLIVFLCNRHNQQSQDGSLNTSHVPHGKHQLQAMIRIEKEHCVKIWCYLQINSANFNL